MDNKDKPEDRPETRPDGTNARPEGDSIAQTEIGLPDDASTSPELTPKEEDEIARKIRSI
jgi:hypothetical protein